MAYPGRQPLLRDPPSLTRNPSRWRATAFLIKTSLPSLSNRCAKIYVEIVDPTAILERFGEMQQCGSLGANRDLKRSVRLE
jgi:hypothetical protein